LATTRKNEARLLRKGLNGSPPYFKEGLGVVAVNSFAFQTPGSGVFQMVT